MTIDELLRTQRPRNIQQYKSLTAGKGEEIVTPYGKADFKPVTDSSSSEGAMLHGVFANQTYNVINEGRRYSMNMYNAKRRQKIAKILQDNPDANLIVDVDRYTTGNYESEEDKNKAYTQLLVNSIKQGKEQEINAMIEKRYKAVEKMMLPQTREEENELLYKARKNSWRYNHVGTDDNKVTKEVEDLF